jgi:cytochrome c peroxidase
MQLIGPRVAALGILMASSFVAALSVAAAPAATAGAGSGTSTPDNAALARIGRLMFFDPSLSASGKLACASCHDPRYAYGPPPGKALAYGGRDMTQAGTRAVPSLRYLHGAPPFAERHRFVDGDIAPVGGFTWDGRAGSLHEQAMLPLLAANEMANTGPGDVAARLSRRRSRTSTSPTWAYPAIREFLPMRIRTTTTWVCAVPFGRTSAAGGSIAGSFVRRRCATRPFATPISTTACSRRCAT